MEVVLSVFVGEAVVLDVVVDLDLALLEVDDEVLLEEELLNNELALVKTLLVGDEPVDKGVVDEALPLVVLDGDIEIIKVNKLVVLVDDVLQLNNFKEEYGEKMLGLMPISFERETATENLWPECRRKASGPTKAHEEAHARSLASAEQVFEPCQELRGKAAQTGGKYAKYK